MRWAHRNCIDQHHVGGHRADHEPKHAPGVISDEGGGDSKTAQTDPKNQTPPWAPHTACEKLLDRDGPVTEVQNLKRLRSVDNKRVACHE